MTPHTSYLICATSRSSSFLLCESLIKNGLAGRPEEYFWRGDEPIFNFETIQMMVQEITAHEAAWQQYFTACSVTPLTIICEDFVPAYEETALRILDYLHVPTPPDLSFGERCMKKQADALSEDWIQGY